MRDLLPWMLMAALTVGWLLDHNAQGPAPEPTPVVETTLTIPDGDTGQVFPLAELVAQLEESGRAYLPFLTVPTLRTGLYALAAGAVDRQQPHDKDEVYYVVQGRSAMTIDEDEYTIKAGDVIFVAANAEHRFHDIEEDLQLIVFFSEADPEATEDQ